LVGALVVATGLVFIAALWSGWIDILPQHDAATGDDQPRSSTAPNVVTLTPEKLAAAELHTTVATKQMVQPTRPVPGQIKYDAARRVPINSPVNGIVMQVLVEPAQQVAKDQQLALLSSREVGEARDEVEKCRADLDLARRDEDRTSRIAENVEALLALLQQRPDPESLESVLAQKSLGDYRANLLSTYSKLVLAERRMRDTTDIGTATLSTRIVEDRKSTREVAAAQFATECDKARFEVRHEKEKMIAASKHAERLLSVAQQNLANLLGPFADMRPISDREHLSEFTLLSPIAGRVEERQAVMAARVPAGGPLFTVADTSTVWVSAEIHERDWAALGLVHQGDSLDVRVPALSGTPIRGKVLYVGGQVAADTRSVPLVAEITNIDDRLKPGMFVWAHIPIEKPHEGLVVPAGAIMRHENQPFVFVPGGDGKFRRVDVSLGLETSDTAEITAGLAAGDRVVDRGAFFLKSELLLDREE
jgi:cobalt-zinc-cadmium efflux system membrane fusion protein